MPSIISLYFSFTNLRFSFMCRRQLVVLGRELLLDQAEFLDRLDPREALIHLLDLRPDQVLHLARAAQRGEVGERHVRILSILRNVVVVDHQQAGQKLALVADHDRVGDVGGELQLVLELRRRDVLAAGGDDDVLHAVGDLEIALVVDEADVAGMQPAVAQRLGGFVRLVVVAHEDVRAAQQDLALRRDLEFGAGAATPTVPSLMRSGMPVASPQFSVWP